MRVALIQMSVTGEKSKNIDVACEKIRETATNAADVAVLPEKRHQSLGDLTLRLLLFKAESHAARLIRLKTPVETAPFFARLGFKPEGDAESGLQQMLLRGEELRLDTCQGCKKDCPNRK